MKIKPYQIIAWTGIAAYLLVLSAAVTGVLNADYNLHRVLGLAAVVLGSLHGLYYFSQRRRRK